LYSFGLPIFLTGLTLGFDSAAWFLPDLRYYVKLFCWIEVSVIGRFTLFAIINVVLGTNIFFFCAAALNIYKVHREIEQMNALNFLKKANYDDFKAK
jgi:hypothetical protein